jgi:hypothetical protein
VCADGLAKNVMGQFFIGKRFEFTELTFDRTWQRGFCWDLATSLSYGFENQKLKIQIIKNDN